MLEVMLTPPNLTGKRILIADDNTVNQTLLVQMLKPTNVDTLVVHNGAQAVAKFKGYQPDLILMDIQMPVMNGILASQLIRRVDKTIPFIAVTANVSQADLQTYRNNHFFGHIAKPIHISTLYRSLQAVFMPMQ
jgi:CheY-like chemotaxis protein